MRKPENEEMFISTNLGSASNPAIRPQNKFFGLFDYDEDLHEYI